MHPSQPCSLAAFHVRLDPHVVREIKDVSATLQPQNRSVVRRLHKPGGYERRASLASAVVLRQQRRRCFVRAGPMGAPLHQKGRRGSCKEAVPHVKAEGGHAEGEAVGPLPAPAYNSERPQTAVWVGLLVARAWPHPAPACGCGRSVGDGLSHTTGWPGPPPPSPPS